MALKTIWVYQGSIIQDYSKENLQKVLW